MKDDFAKVIGEAVLLASMQFAIGSVEMSSKFSVINFSKDQITLQRAADALKEYMIIGLVWTIGVMFILYANFKLVGLISGFICNMIILAWIYISYIRSFKLAAKYNNLSIPKTFKFF